MLQQDHYVGVEFHRFKAFKSFSIDLKKFNIMVGPNNAGKSTVLAAFRILAAAIRRAENKKASIVQGRNGVVHGYQIDLRTISVAEENLFYNYDDDEAAWVEFKLASGNSLTLYFPEPEVCYLLPDSQGKSFVNPAAFKANFRCSISFVPILGPVDHRERLFEKEAARLALFNYGAARNFRNIWWHYPENFDEFRSLIRDTWPGMDVSPPEVDRSHDRPLLHMWCPEERKAREIFWAGFGFQVWCQMVTHLIQARSASIFLIDEPDIYLHSDLQRRLLGILRDLGPDILIATHSTEIIIEAESDEIVLVDKRRRRSSRIRSTAQLPGVFQILGSSVNPILTQLAKTKRVLFVEGLDMQILGRFARKAGVDKIASRSDFAVVPVEGFNPDRIRTLKNGMEQTLGVKVATAAMLDRDYISDAECRKTEQNCETFCDMAIIHDSKEIEKFLLVPEAIDRAVALRLADRVQRGGQEVEYTPFVAAFLDDFAESKRNYITSQYIAARRRHERTVGSEMFEETLSQQELDQIAARWKIPGNKLKMIPGKEALSALNVELQARYGVSVTPSIIIDSMKVSEVPLEMVNLLNRLDKFVKEDPT